MLGDESPLKSIELCLPHLGKGLRKEGGPGCMSEEPDMAQDRDALSVARASVLPGHVPFYICQMWSIPGPCFNKKTDLFLPVQF